jgi:hypothetical protein
MRIEAANTTSGKLSPRVVQLSVAAMLEAGDQSSEKQRNGK